MKTSLLAGTMLVMLFALPSPPAEAQGGRGLARIRETGELRVGVSGEQPPLNMTAKNGGLFGMEIDLMRLLGPSLGAEVIFVKLPFGDLLAALDAGKFDIVMSGMTITPARAERALFVGPYYSSGKAVLTKRADLAGAASPKTLDEHAPRVVALAGSTSEAFARRTLPNAKLEVSVTLGAAIEKVRRGSVDLLLADRETCSFAALRHPDEGLLVSDATFTVEPIGVAVPFDQPRLAELLDHYFAALRNTGALETSRAVWFDNASWIDALP